MTKNLTAIIIIIFLLTNMNLYAFDYMHSINNIQTNALGHEKASKYYESKTHEFLMHFGIHDDIPVYQWKPQQNNLFTMLDLCNILGFTSITAIWLNEDMLKTLPESEQIFVVAHEAAHFALKHPQNILLQTFCVTITSIATFYTIDALDQPLPSTSYYSPVLAFAGRWIKRSALATVLYQFLAKPIADNGAICAEQQADLNAVRILWKHGYKKVIIDHIAYLKILIEKGYGEYTDNRHPTIAQEYQYTKKYFESLQSKSSQLTNEKK